MDKFTLVVLLIGLLMIGIGGWLRYYKPKPKEPKHPAYQRGDDYE